MMHMTFYWGRQVTVLFDFWKTQTWLDYSLTLLACLLFSAFYQYLDNLRLNLNLNPNPDPNPSRFALIQNPLIARYATKLPGGGLSSRAAGSVLFAVTSALGYMLMLAVMSFNGGVFIAIVAGLALGYFFFRSSSGGVAVDSACACA